MVPIIVRVRDIDDRDRVPGLERSEQLVGSVADRDPMRRTAEIDAIDLRRRWIDGKNRVAEFGGRPERAVRYPSSRYAARQSRRHRWCARATWKRDQSPRCGGRDPCFCRRCRPHRPSRRPSRRRASGSAHAWRPACRDRRYGPACRRRSIEFVGTLGGENERCTARAVVGINHVAPLAAPAPPRSWPCARPPRRAFPFPPRPPLPPRARMNFGLLSLASERAMSASAFCISLASRARSAARSMTPLSGSAAASPRTTSCTEPCGAAGAERNFGHARQPFDEFGPALARALRLG